MTKLTIRVIPRASRVKVSTTDDGTLKVHVTAPPVDGAANEAVVKALADALGVKAAGISIASGHTSKTKVVAVEGLSLEDALARLTQQP